MGLRDRFERTIGLGRSDEPRAVAVEARRATVVRPVESVVGARVRISRDGRDGELARVLVWCHRRGTPVELVDGPNGLWLDGVAVSPAELRAKLG